MSFSNFFWWLLNDKKQSWDKFGSWFYSEPLLVLIKFFCLHRACGFTSRPVLLTLKCGLSSLKERSWTIWPLKSSKSIITFLVAYENRSNSFIALKLTQLKLYFSWKKKIFRRFFFQLFMRSSFWDGKTARVQTGGALKVVNCWA